MFSGKLGRRTLTSWIAGAMLALAVPALAQTGRIQGKVVDDKDAAVAGCADSRDGDSRSGRPEVAGDQRQERQLHHRHAAEVGPVSRRRLERRRRRGRGARRGEDRQLHDDELQAVARRARQRGAGEEERRRSRSSSRPASRPHRRAITRPPSRRSPAPAVAMPTCADCYFNVGVSQQQLKNQRGRRSGLQEGDRAAAELPRGVQRACGALHGRTRRWTSRRRPRPRRRS